MECRVYVLKKRCANKGRNCRARTNRLRRKVSLAVLLASAVASGTRCVNALLAQSELTIALTGT